MMVVGWMRILTSSFALLNSSAAISTTLVVPSPTSLSCCCARSTSILPAGWSTDSKLNIVAPSFVTVTSPMSSTIILSRPEGPKEDLTMLAMACVASTFWSRMSAPEIFWPPRKRVPALRGASKMPAMAAGGGR